MLFIDSKACLQNSPHIVRSECRYVIGYFHVVTKVADKKISMVSDIDGPSY
jgi:hypothetical protein